MRSTSVVRYDNQITHLLRTESHVVGFAVPRRTRDGWPCRRCAVVATDTLERLILNSRRFTIDSIGVHIADDGLALKIEPKHQRPQLLCPTRNAFDQDWLVDISGECDCDDCDGVTWNRFVRDHPRVVDAVTRAAAATARQFVARVLAAPIPPDVRGPLVESLFKTTPSP